MRAHCISMNDVHFHKTIREMRRGEYGWTVPLAYSPSDGQISLHYAVHSEPKGVADMRIECIVPETLYHAWPLRNYRCGRVTEKGTARCSPRRKSCVKFEKATGPSFYVWTDLPAYRIKHIPGVSFASSYSKCHIRVTIDPRYDIQDIQNEIRFLAERQ